MRTSKQCGLEQYREEAVELIHLIASYYEDPDGASTLLFEWAKRGTRTLMNLRLLEFVERKIFLTRKKNHLSRRLELLKIALDDAPIYRKGHSLGLPAYEAEMYYVGNYSDSD